jgi:hypothetical protein
VIAKTIDITDGNEFFHYSLTKWILSVKYKPEHVPEKTALTYTFDTYEKIRDNLVKLQIEEKYILLSKKLLDEQIKFVKACWHKVPTKLIPDDTKKSLDRF